MHSALADSEGQLCFKFTFGCICSSVCLSNLILIDTIFLLGTHQYELFFSSGLRIFCFSRSPIFGQWEHLQTGPWCAPISKGWCWFFEHLIFFQRCKIVSNVYFTIHLWSWPFFIRKNLTLTSPKSSGCLLLGNAAQNPEFRLCVYLHYSWCPLLLDPFSARAGKGLYFRYL